MVAGYPREHGDELLVDVEERQADLVTAESQPPAPGDLGAQLDTDIAAAQTDVSHAQQWPCGQDTHAAGRQVQHRSKTGDELLLGETAGDPATLPATEEPAQSHGGVELHVFHIVGIVPWDERSGGGVPKEATFARVGSSARSKRPRLNQDRPDRR